MSSDTKHTVGTTNLNLITSNGEDLTAISDAVGPPGTDQKQCDYGGLTAPDFSTKT